MEGTCGNSLGQEWSLQWNRKPRGAAACGELCGPAPEGWPCEYETVLEQCLETCSVWEAHGDQFKMNGILWEIHGAGAD